MKTALLKPLSVPFSLTLFIVLTAFHQPCEPTSVVVDSEPMVFISKGLNKMESVEVRNIQASEVEADLVSKTLGGFLNTGFTIENATEVLADRFQLSTYYLSKKAI